ncbi:acetyl-CoA carboxylase carboxyltransferase subunit alpha [Hwanghaeella grinnelliae]|uniref:Acetyl-coenzyme A carboxylase carboxyl transferase subunit alpha n=1 Tax=Hwanghaeella grinnelliae TaxID=2500179 RepID=A0A3S2Z7J4_9PROT|nr:acetyl-CoA carboxylase carboxyltransferase subunit alpha [Hwanghaeella grinnelliae]RVU36493.1 acetyl-CoA carboxylase carboxyltransferase subunit alpha [Hwanghaeella grinnelliae]
MRNFLDFEQPIAELEGKIEELRHLADTGEVNIADEVGKLQTKVDRLITTTYAKLTPWQKVQVARHPDRPHFKNYVSRMFTDYQPLSGDRSFADDHAILGGIGRFRGRSCVVIGHEKGGDTQARIKHNFGMARPEGYRKAQRLMELAERFQLPVITLVDTPGAYPGVGAEERGQSEAIARSIELCLNIRVPLVATIIGEGGSGGAIALAAGDAVFMLENSVYSVISPEGCASILWRSAEEAQTAAEALRLTAQDLEKLKVIDRVIKEPVGGAHREPDEAVDKVSDEIEAALTDLCAMEPGALRARRREKFLAMGRHGLS